MLSGSSNEKGIYGNRCTFALVENGNLNLFLVRTTPKMVVEDNSRITLILSVRVDVI